MILVADPPPPLVTDAFALTLVSPDLVEDERAFAYLVRDRAEDQALGGLCIDPLFPYLSAKGASAKTLNRYAGGAAARVTLWIREPAGASILAVIDEWLRTRWSLDSYVYRVLSNDRATVEAVDRLRLEHLVIGLPAEQIPYVWWSSSR